MKYTFVNRPNSAPGGRTDTIRFPWRVDTIEAFCGFQQAGYIKVCHIPDAPWLDEPYWWLSSISNIFYQDGMKTVNDIAKMPRSKLNSGAWSMFPEIMGLDANDALESFENLDDSTAVKVMANRLIPDFMKKSRNRLQFMWDKRYHNECGMYTDFIQVHEPYRGTGLAEMLYYRAALWAKSQGKRYRFSGCQSDAARKVMQRFIERGMITTENRRMHRRVYTFNYLDTTKPLWIEG